MKTTKFDDLLQGKLMEPSFSAASEGAGAKPAFATALKKAREDAGLSQRKLAELASVPQSTIARIEQGDNTTLDTMSKLAHALGKTLEVSFV